MIRLVKNGYPFSQESIVKGTMEERALPILKSMLEKRGISVANVNTLANPMDDTAM